jgi:hypothetical protein
LTNPRYAPDHIRRHQETDLLRARAPVGRHRRRAGGGTRPNLDDQPKSGKGEGDRGPNWVGLRARFWVGGGGAGRRDGGGDGGSRRVRAVVLVARERIKSLFVGALALYFLIFILCIIIILESI